jgi:hypothetical protein
MTFMMIRKILEEVFRCDQLNDGVTQKLQSLVVTPRIGKINKLKSAHADLKLHSRTKCM